jgi:Flp pilus assembly protein CpaB
MPRPASPQPTSTQPTSTPWSTDESTRNADLMRRLGPRWRRLRRAVLARRRLLAAVLAGLAVVTGVRAASLPPTEMTTVIVAADDLAAGSVLTTRDLTTAELPVDAVPGGAVPDLGAVEGRTLAAPLRRGEPLTDLRLVAPAILDGYPGLVATPVRVADPAAARLLAVGDRIDLLAVSPEVGRADVVAEAAPVVAVPEPSPDDGVVGGALVVVAVPESQAMALAEAAVRSVLSVVLRR